MSDPLFIIEFFTVCILGLILGSFSTALIWRVPRKMNWGMVRSKCTMCNRSLTMRDLVPLFSWLAYRGACRKCSQKISVIYPLIEMLCACLCVGVYIVYGFTVEAFIFISSVPFLLALFVIDLRQMILPNQLVFILLLIGIARLIFLSFQNVFHGAGDLFFEYGVGALIYACLPCMMSIILTRILKRESLGMGDVKFFFVTGIWLGLSMLPEFFMLSGGLAVLMALFWRIVFKKQVFPFGPALILSFYGLMIFQGSFLM